MAEYKIPDDGKVTVDDSFIYGTSTGELFWNDGHDRNTLDARAGNDNIDNTGKYVYIDGGAGNDTIYNYTTPDGDGGEYTTVHGGAGNDSIKNFSSVVAIYGDAGDDVITNNAATVTLRGGTGNDTINLPGGTANKHDVLIRYGEGDGNDIIIGFGKETEGEVFDTLQLLDEVDIVGGWIADNKSDVVLQVGTGGEVSGTITLTKVAGEYAKQINIVRGNDLEEDYVETKTFESTVITNDGDDWVEGDVLNDFIENNVEEATIEGKGGGDYITNNGAKSSVNGNLGDDNIINYANGATLNGDEGNDTVTNYGSSVVANGGADNDHIINEGAKAKLNGNAGDDFISNSGENVTVTGGAGNDTVSLDGGSARIMYGNGDGNDVICGYDGNATVKITSGTYNVSSNGLDEVIKVGSGSLTIKDANGKNIIIVGADGKTQTVPGGKFDSINNDDGVVFKGNANANRLSNTGDYITVNALGGDDVIQNEGDYVSISGGAGNDYIYDKSYNGSNTINAGDGNDTIRFADTSARHTVEYVGGNDVIDGFTENDVLKIVSGGIDLDNPEVDGDDVIFTTDNGTLTFKGGSGVQITIVDADGEETSDIYGPITVSNLTDSKIDGTKYNDTLGNFADRATIKGNTGDDHIINEGALARIDAGAGADSISNSGVKATILGGAGDDYIFNSGANASITGGDGNDHIVNTGRRATIDGGKGDDYIEGTDDYAEVFKFKGGDGNDQIVNFGAGDSLQISGSIVGRGYVEGDYVVTVKSGSTVSTVTLKDVGSKKFTFEESTLRLTNSIVPTSLIETVNSADGANFSAPEAEDKRYYMINTGADVTVRTSRANDIVEGSDLYGEVFQFGATDGNDTILNFRANDTLQAVNGTLSFETVDNDVVVSIAGSKTAKVTLQGAAGLNIRTSGKNYLIGSEPVNEVENRANNEKVVGTDGADYITNSYANATIDGKGGNDTIEGSTYGEMILFGATDGKDVVTGFDENDSIKINMGNVEAMTKVGDDYIINVRSSQYSGSITLKDAFKDDPKRRFKLDGTVITEKRANQIINREDDKKVRGTSDEDYITNNGQNATIRPGAGNDTVELGSAYAELIEFSNLDGENIVLNFDTTDTIHATSGTLSAGKSGDDIIVTIKSGTGSSVVRLNDAGDAEASLDSTKKYLRITTGIPTLYNHDPDVKFPGTKDAEYMVNTGDNVTIQGNGGADTIIGADHGERFQVASDHGNDVITNFGKNDTLQCTAGNIASYWVEGNDVIVSLKGVSYQETIRLQNTVDYEFIKNGNILTVKPDTTPIFSSRDGEKLVGSSNTEVFYISHDKVSVEGNGGQDTIYASNQLDIFRASSAHLNGNVIVGFGEDDTLQVIGGNLQPLATIGNDVLVSLKGASYAGDYLLKDVADKNYQWIYKDKKLYVDAKHDITVGGNKERVTGTGGRDYIVNPDYENVTIQANGGTDTIVGSEAYGDVFVFAASSGNNLIKQFEAKDTLIMSSAGTMSYATSGDDVIVTIEGNGEDSLATVTLEGAAGLDFIQNGATLTVDAPTEMLYNYTDGVTFSAENVKGDYMINDGARVTIQAGSGNDTMKGSDLYGETFLVASNTGNNVVIGFNELDTLTCTAGKIVSYSTIKGTDDVLVSLKGSTYSGTVTLKDAAKYTFKQSGQNLIVAPTYNLINNTTNKLKVVGKDGNEGKDLIINSGDNVSIQSGAGYDTIYGSDLFAETFLFSSADDSNLVYGFGSNDTLLATGGKIQAVNKVGDDVVVNLKGAQYSGNVTLAGAGSLHNDMRWTTAVLTVDAVNNIVSTKSDATVFGSSGRDWITSTGENVWIAPGTGKDTITGSDYYGDVFLIAPTEGDKIITNFQHNDTIRATSGTVKSIARSGDDVLVTVGSGNKSAVVTLLDAAGPKFKTTDGSKNLVVSNITERTNSNPKVTFSGGSGMDYMYNSGANVTINSGADNDTIEGSDEYGEMFLFASNTGDNVIINFRSNDTIKCTAGSIASVNRIDGTDDVLVSLKGASYSGTVTLKDAARLEFQKDSKFLTAKSGVNIISNDRDGIKVVGTSGDDWIVNSGVNVSIEGKGGQDTIEAGNFGETFLFSSADKNNVIVGFDVDDSLKMTAGSTLLFETVGADVVVTLKGATYTGMETLQGAAGLNFAKKKVNNAWTLYVDTPAPSILNQKDGEKVTGTDKAEKIINTCENVTIEAKSGDDTIYGSIFGEVFTFAASDGGDNIIVNFNENDTLRATKGTIKSNVISGDDCIVTIADSKSSITVTLKDAGKNGFSVSGDKTILRMFDRSNKGLSAEMPADEDGYWFLDKETTADSLGEVDAMLAEVDSDNSLGKLSLNDPSELLMNVDGSARSERLLTTVARHRNINK